MRLAASGCGMKWVSRQSQTPPREHECFTSRSTEVKKEGPQFNYFCLNLRKSQWISSRRFSVFERHCLNYTHLQGSQGRPPFPAPWGVETCQGMEPWHFSVLQNFAWNALNSMHYFINIKCGSKIKVFRQNRRISVRRQRFTDLQSPLIQEYGHGF